MLTVPVVLCAKQVTAEIMSSMVSRRDLVRRGMFISFEVGA
jgi:hypothetical protein